MKRKMEEQLPGETTPSKRIKKVNPHRTVNPQTWYRFNSLALNGFADVCDLLQFQGWSFICSEEFGKMANGFDIELVRQFYAQLHSAEDDDSKLETIVNRKKIRFGHEDITTFICSLSDADGNLDGTESGLTLNYNEYGKTFDHFDPKKDVAPLLKPVFSTLPKPCASHLTVPNRLLLHIVNNCIIPKSGSRTYLPTMVLALLHYINTKRKVNLAHLMVGHMLSVTTHPLVKLPHATFLTLWLKSHWKVSPKDLNMYYIPYDNVTLTHMFSYDEKTRTWSSKANPTIEINDANEVFEPPMATPPDPSMSSPSTVPVIRSDPSMDTPSNPFPTHQQHHASSDPTVNSMLSAVLDKLDLLSIKTPSVDNFNSVSEQLVTMNQNFHNMSCTSFRKIEDTVGKFNDQMKGYGHNNLECIRKIHKDQEEMKYQVFNVEESMESIEGRMKAIEEKVAAIHQMVGVLYSTHLAGQLRRK